MTFAEAVVLLKHGHMMRRRAWARQKYWITSFGDTIMYHTLHPKEDGVFSLRLSDIAGEDWEEMKT